MRKGGSPKKQSGGYLVGASHEEGGIPATVMSTGEEIELEGAQYIINADTVAKLGVDFFDKLNRTGTRHWNASSGFQPGELKVDGRTIFAAGGYINDYIIVDW